MANPQLNPPLYLLYIEQRALHRYVTITVPFSFFSAISDYDLNLLNKAINVL